VKPADPGRQLERDYMGTEKNVSNVDIAAATKKFLAATRKTYPCHVNRISQLDDPCERRLYYHRTAWNLAAPPSPYLMGIFQTGSILEPAIRRIISELGESADPPFRIIGSEISTRDKLLEEHQISGRIDGFLQIKRNGRWMTDGVIDIKTASGNVFNTLTSYESLMRYPHTRSYRGQLMLYALAHNVERCHILFVNKNNLFEVRLISFDLDMEYAEQLLKKAKRVNAAIVGKIEPPKLNDPEYCQRCPYAAICCPEYTTGGDFTVEDNDDLAGVLDRLEELSDLAGEIAELEKVRESLLVKGRNTLCGRWLIQWKRVAGTRKPSPGGPFEYWKKRITPVESNK